MSKLRAKKNILLVVLRDNFEKDIPFIRDISKEFTELGYEVHWHKPTALTLMSMIDPEGRPDKLPVLLRSLSRIFAVIKTPYLWEYVIQRPQVDIPIIPVRCYRLKRHIMSFGKNINLVVLARSAGGRIASMIADEAGIKKLICLGYPFKHPDLPAEVERFEHLPSVKTPFLILQGTDDVYGGREITSMYDLSPATSVKFIETSHEFRLNRQQWVEVLSDIKNFISTDHHRATPA